MIGIEDLGISKEEMISKVVDRIAVRMLREERISSDEDGVEYDVGGDSEFGKEVRDRIKEKVESAIDEIAAKNVLPNMTKYVEDFCIQKTNSYGEKIADPMTFTEYLVKRAEDYMQEGVDYDGRSANDPNRRSYTSMPKAHTRLTYLIDKHLQYTLSTAIEKILKNGNEQIVKSVRESAIIQLNDIAKKLKIEVKTR